MYQVKKLPQRYKIAAYRCGTPQNIVRSVFIHNFDNLPALKDAVAGNNPSYRRSRIDIGMTADYGAGI